MTQRVISDIGACEISSLPGQSQVAVCHSFFVHAGHRGQGHAHTLKALQRHALQAMHYDFAICTVAADNAAQIAVIRQAGWMLLAEFKNHRSCEVTQVWGTHL